MEFIGSFGRAAGAVLGLYVGLKSVIEIVSHLFRKRKEKKDQRKQAQKSEQEQAASAA